MQRRIDAEHLQAAEIQVNDIDGGGFQDNLELVMLIKAVRVLAVAGVLRTAGRLNIGRTPGLRPKGPEEGCRVRSAGTDFGVDRL